MSSPTKRPAEAEGARLHSTDDFLGGRISVMQPRKGHRAGSDAVFLAAAVPAHEGERVLDAGAGVGVAGLCLLARVPAIEVTAVEIDPELCDLAAENAKRNGFAARFVAINADVTAPGKMLQGSGIEREAYAHVLANPPFHAEGSVRSAPAKHSAHVMGEGGLGAWIKFLASMAAPKGSVTLIHRPEHLGELLAQLEPRFGAITIFPLFPNAAAPAARIIVQAHKGSRAPTRLLRGLVLHQYDGRYTEEAEAVLREAKPLKLET